MKVFVSEKRTLALYFRVLVVLTGLLITALTYGLLGSVSQQKHFASSSRSYPELPKGAGSLTAQDDYSFNCTQANITNFTGRCDVIKFLNVFGNYGDESRRPLPLEFLRGCHQVFFNRIPKTGSRTAHDVIVSLGRKHNFHVRRKAKGMGRNPSGREHKVETYIRTMSKMPDPIVVIKHVYFIDFVRRMRKSMVMLNVMRDPVEQVISLYSWAKFGDVGTLREDEAKQRMSLDECVAEFGPSDRCYFWHMTAIPFFCGDEDHSCWTRERTTREQLQKAKWNIDNTYLLVGVMEDFPGFFNALETLLPQFFCNATSLYHEVAVEMYELYRTSHRETVSKSTMAKLQEHLQYDIELYQFVKQRFYDNLSKIRKHRSLVLGLPQK